MIRGYSPRLILALSVLLCAPARALEITLAAIEYPQNRTIEVPFQSTESAPDSRIKASVRSGPSRAQVRLEYARMQPAILFGGDITSYVLWSLAPDGRYRNLGELAVSNRGSGALGFVTDLTEFALVVTAEPYYLVAQPSDLLIAHSHAAGTRGVTGKTFGFFDFVPAVSHTHESVNRLRWNRDVPVDLVAARKTYELAGRWDGEKLAPRQFEEARAALVEAERLAARRQGGRQLELAARQSLSASNKVLKIARFEQGQPQLEERPQVQSAVAAQTPADPESNPEASQRGRVDLPRPGEARPPARITSAKQQDGLSLQQQWLAAFSLLGETHTSERGSTLYLPDGLFDIDRATLRPEATILLAKLAGMLLILPHLSLQVEGHTDSTEEASYSMELSRERAQAVAHFIQAQGVEQERVDWAGHGLERPIADNATYEGRKRNRRVEVTVSEPGQREAAAGRR